MKIYKKTIYLIIFILISIGLYIGITSFNEYEIIERQSDNFFNNQSPFDLEEYRLFLQIKDAKWTQVSSGFVIAINALYIFIVLIMSIKEPSDKLYISIIILIITLNFIIIITSSVFFIILSRINITSSSNESLINIFHTVQSLFLNISSLLFCIGIGVSVNHNNKKVKEDLTH